MMWTNPGSLVSSFDKMQSPEVGRMGFVKSTLLIYSFGSRKWDHGPERHIRNFLAVRAHSVLRKLDNIHTNRTHILKINPFLCAFAELRKATVSFAKSVRLSAWNDSAATGRIFMKSNIREFFENVYRNFTVSPCISIHYTIMVQPMHLSVIKH
jgi:hypothetical protein